MQYEISHLHLELSSLCNARCPLCPRNFQGFPANMGYEETNLDLDSVQKSLPPELLSKVNFVLINGNFGDFVMNPQSVEIIQYLKQHIHSYGKIEVHTNGSARDRQFWTDLGSMNIRIKFNIDGIGDTNNLYRQDTNFDTIVKNAQTFIAAGGYAMWNMTIFDHNKDQIESVKVMAKELGFAESIFRDTDRDRGPVYNRKGKKIHWLKDDWTWADQIDESFIQQRIVDARSWPPNKPQDKTISCWAKKDKSVYIAADGHVYPCCWVGHSPTTYKSHTSMTHWNEETAPLVANNHAPTVGIKAAMQWFESLANTWDSEHKPGVCLNTCSS
jgi:sulfatase maturation enzyme AslB (radical SAM superfamily)